MNNFCIECGHYVPAGCIHKPSYTVQTSPQDIFVKFEIWVNPKDNYRELEKMLGRLLDAWVTDLVATDGEVK